MEETNYSAEDVILACQRIKEYDEQMLMCLDYILASTEFEEFYQLIMEFKVIYLYIYIYIYSILNINIQRKWMIVKSTKSSLISI